MSDGTMHPSTDAVASCAFDVEFTQTLNTGRFRTSTKMSEFPRITSLRNLFASVTVSSVTAEVRQDTDVGGDGLNLGGHIYVAIIPSSKDSDSTSGASSVIVNNVPNKQTFPIAGNDQANRLFNFNLTGYEVDLAQDPRRGAGPVAWIGNSGVTKAGDDHVPICTVTWRITVTCSGSTPLWQ